MGGGGVELLGERAEVDILHPQPIDGAHHLDERAPEPVELPHHEHVLGSEIGQRRLELRALGPSFAGPLLLEQALAASLGQRVALEVEVLVEGRDAGISDEHVGMVNQQRLIRNRKADIFSRQKRSRLGRLPTCPGRMSGKRSFSGHIAGGATYRCVPIAQAMWNSAARIRPCRSAHREKPEQSVRYKCAFRQQSLAAAPNIHQRYI